MENKKNPQLDLRKKSGLFLNIGFAISLSFVLFAFEYKSYINGSLITLTTINEDFPDMLDMPPTKQTPPPPPKKQLPEIKVVEDNIDIEEIDINLDTEMTDEDRIERIEIDDNEGVEEIPDIPFTVVEQMPNYPGGLKALYGYFGKKMKYPSQARKMGIEGRVIITFVIDKDGSITDLKLLRGIGAGCDEEAIRVLKMLPKWNPGKQRGKPVKVQMTIPINFKLN
ncbi:MAG: energy transducer TonB [Cyclobacteriaceae bacterium]|nr:energy transducer TonB [Cyclobacteriaceae bacterium]